MARVKHTKTLRQELLKSIVTIFGNLVERDDLFKVSTFLDPNFGLCYFKVEHHDDVLKRVKANFKGSF